MADSSAYGAVDLQGHRGARGLVPENTIPVFRKALDIGVTTLELDVVVTSDSQVVVSHEPWFSSSICTTPGGEPILEDEERTFNIYEMTYDSVRGFDCGSRGNPNFPEQEAMTAEKPRLDSVLAFAERYADEIRHPQPRYNIEIKSRPEYDDTFTPPPARFARLVYRVITGRDLKDRTTIQSFDPRALVAMRAIDDDVELVLLVDNDLGFDANLERLGFTPEVYSPHHRLVDEGLVRSVHEKDMKLIPWTINDPDEMRRLLDIGVDGIITDYPDRAAPLLK